MSTFLERYQVGIYLVALVAGVLFPFGAMRGGVEIALGLLLFMTFMCIPLREVQFDRRFLAVVLGVNFIAAPIVALLLAMILPNTALAIPVLLVLLAPCVDYVVVFTGLAGGAKGKLLTATPLLLAIQMLLIPVVLGLYASASSAEVLQIEWTPFLKAFLFLIVLPLGLAWLIQATPLRGSVTTLSEAFMVPLMAFVLFAISSGYSMLVVNQREPMLRIIVVFAAFAIIMAVFGFLAARAADTDRETQIAVSFSGATRNSLVVMPLALALPTAYETAPAIVLTQTFVELIFMLIFVLFWRSIERRK